MEHQLEQIPKVLQIYLQISQYPILGHRIRERMRTELFARGIITPEQKGKIANMILDPPPFPDQVDMDAAEDGRMIGRAFAEGPARPAGRREGEITLPYIGVIRMSKRQWITLGAMAIVNVIVLAIFIFLVIFSPLG